MCPAAKLSSSWTSCPFATRNYVNVYGREVTEQEAARRERETMLEALRRSESQYRTLFDSIDEGFCVIEVLFDEGGKPVDYVFLEANPAFERQTGLVNALAGAFVTWFPCTNSTGSRHTAASP